MSVVKITILTIIIFGELFLIAGSRRYYPQYNIINSVQTIYLYCNREESRIFDCAFGTNAPQSCFYYFNVACTPGIVLYI